MSVWQPVSLSDGACVHWQIGPLDLWVQRTASEWRATSSLEPGRDEAMGVHTGAEVPADAVWRRWTADAGDQTVRAAPVMPDRPVVVRPDGGLTILPGHEALFFVSIPLWVRVMTGSVKSTVLCEEKTMTLSNSWFGTVTEGELCYALKIRAYRSLEEVASRPYRAICAVELKNRNRQPLEFQRLCLRVATLHVYAGRQHLWTNAGRVSYQGEEQLTRVVYASTPPAFDEAEEEIGKAREPGQRRFALKSFDNLLTFSLP